MLGVLASRVGSTDEASGGLTSRVECSKSGGPTVGRTDSDEKNDTMTTSARSDAIRVLNDSDHNPDWQTYEFRFTSYAYKKGYPIDVLTDAESSDQDLQNRLFGDIVAGLSNSSLQVLTGIKPNTKLCGTKAWAALITHFEGDGAHSVGDIIVEFWKVQNYKETCTEFFNSKVALMTRLHRACMSASFPESHTSESL